MMYGIPNMKLEKHIIDRRVNLMKEEGVTFLTNADVGNTIAAEELMEHYDAVVLCCGASNPRDLNNPGRDAQGIHFAVEFLRLNTKSLLDSNLTDGKNISAKGKNVIVVGGGDTGNDCIGTCIRHGCKSITALEMMPEPSEERLPSNPWPQWPRVKKTDYGHEEAIAVFGHDPRLYQTTVKEFHKDENGNLCAVTIVHLESKKDEQTGRFMMVPVEGSEETLPCELLLIAAGFLGSQQYVSQAFGVELNQRTNVKTAAESYKTNVEKVFTAGDMHRGQSLVVWGIAEGRACAREVDEYLMGYTCL
jgi:glutamate synthase (NADPH/NADH) small chain